ncbi:MAG: hypothetical protein Q7T78_21760 [Rhodoferax sp.]|nr:hypothetical protein [Rhodoferax sp.]
MNTVGAESVAGTPGTVVKMAPSEQQEAQALHFCLAAWLDFATAGASSAAAIVANAPERISCTDSVSP